MQRSAFELDVNDAVLMDRFIEGVNLPSELAILVVSLQDKYEDVNSLAQAVSKLHQKYQQRKGYTKPRIAPATTRRPVATSKPPARKASVVVVDELEASDEEEALLMEEEVEVNAEDLEVAPAEKRRAGEEAGGAAMRQLK